jgi:hypothetical protein
VACSITRLCLCLSVWQANLCREPLVPQQLANMSWAVAKVPHSAAGTSLLAAMAAQLPGLVSVLKPKELANTAWAFGKAAAAATAAAAAAAPGSAQLGTAGGATTAGRPALIASGEDAAAGGSGVTGADPTLCETWRMAVDACGADAVRRQFGGFDVQVPVSELK